MLFFFSLETLKIAHEYHDLACKKICENHVRRGITVENVAHLYTLTLKLDTQVIAKFFNIDSSD